MAMTRYKKRQGFENRLRQLARHSRESAKRRMFDVRFGWETPQQTVRTFVIHVGQPWDGYTRHRLSGRIVRCSVKKWHAVIDEVCKLEKVFTSYGGISNESTPVDIQKVNVRCALPSEVQAYINERDQGVTFEAKVLTLNV